MRKIQLPKKFSIENIEIWNADEILVAQDILIEDGYIKRISPHGTPVDSSYARIKTRFKQLIPAGVDAQVHLRVPGQPEKETATTGLRAAAKGGYACILTMPNTKPVIDSIEVLSAAKTFVQNEENEIGVKVFWSAAVTHNQDGFALCKLMQLAEAGAIAFTDDGKGVSSDQLMSEAFQVLSSLDLPFLQHAEMPGHGGVLAPGPLQQKMNIKAYDKCQEVDMVKRDLELLKKHPKARYHVLHVSSLETVALVAQAKRDGLYVTCEVSPHHLYFDSDQITENTSFKMNPPLRTKADREALVAALASGDIDFVATDHAPHELAKKQVHFNEAAFGTTGLETSLRVLLDLYAKKLLSAKRLVQVFSSSPADFLRLSKQYGRLEVGRKFCAVGIDANDQGGVITDPDLESLSQNNCFLGQKLAGSLDTTFLGEIAWKLQLD